VKKPLKIAGIVIGLLIVLIAVAAVVVPRVVDPNAHKDEIIALVERQTGRKLSIPGNIGISVFPWLGANVGAVELGNAPGFESSVFARVEQVRVRVKILPLLTKRVEADVVTIRGLTLNLEKAKDGRTNLDDLTKPAGVEKPESGGTQTSPVAALAIGGVDIRDAAVTWSDHATGQKIAAANLSVKTSAITLVDPVDVTMGFDVDAGDAAPKARLDASARLTLDVPGQRYRLEGLALTADLKGKALPGENLRIKAAGAASFDAGSRLVELSGVRLEAGDLSFPPYKAAAVLEAGGTGELEAMVFNLPDLKATVSIVGGGDRIRAGLTAKARVDLTGQKIVLSDLALEMPELAMKDMEARLTAPSRATAVFDMAAETFAVEDFRLSGTLSGKALPGGSMPVDVALGFRGDLNRQTVSVKPLRIEAMGMKTEGSLSVGGFQSNPEVMAVLAVAPFSPKALLSKLVKEPPKTADPNVLSSAELNVSIAASADAVRVDKLSASIDDTRISGSASIRRFATPDVGFDFAVDRINLDRYLPPTTPGGEPAAAAPAAGAAGAATLPLETLRKLSVSGKLRFSSLTTSGVKMTDLAVAVEAKDGVLRTDPVSASLYGGSFNGSVVLDVRSAEPKVSFDEKLSRVNLEGLFKDTGIDAGAVNLSGPTSLMAKGEVAADSALKNIRVERLDIEGSLGGRLAVGINTVGALNLGDQTWTSEDSRLKLGDMNLRAKARVSGLSSKPSVSAEIAAPAFNLRQVLTQLNMLPETADAKAMTAVELNASFSASPDALSVSALKARMDDTRLEGTLSATLGPTPNYGFDIRLDAIDADRYLPPPKPSAQPAASTPGAAAAEVPVDPLKTLSLDGKLALGKLKIANARLSDIRVEARAKDGLLTLNPLSASLYGGAYKGNVTVDARTGQPRLSLDEQLTGVQAGPLLKDLQGRSLLTGLANATVKVSAVGAISEALTQTLAGNVNFQLKDGSIENMDILGKICRALEAVSLGSFKKEDLVGGLLQMAVKPARGEAAEAGGRTEFSEMHGSMTFSDGVGSNDDLLVQSPLLRVEGVGKLDLPKMRVDYRVTTALVKSCEGQGGKSFRELANYPIPVTITGPLDKPDVKPDLTAGIIEILTRKQTQEPAAAPSAPKQPGQETAPQQATPKDTKKQAEDAAKDAIQKGLQDLFKKK
jgi:AsmA protein